jgi:hypothetical protein
MLYTKKIEEITHKDIVDFCNEQIRENISLDYKETINSSLAKTIAAMANTWGGLIVIGAEDNDSKPKLPLKGIEFKEHLREQINNIILGNITPPVFPEIQVCSSDDNTTGLIVIRVSQSNTTPHAIRGNTKVYIRTDTSNELEELATVDRVLWLVNKREKSVKLKNSFFDKSQSRLQKLTGKKIPIEHADVIMSASPLYPYEAMIDYRKLRNGILEQIRTQGSGQSFPVNVYNTRFEPTQNGSYSLIYKQDTGFVSYEEMNHYGFFYHRKDTARSEKKEDGKIQHLCYPIYILVELDLFLQSMEKFYSALGYWGFIEIKVILDNVGEVSFTDLPAPRGKFKLDREFRTPIDNTLSITKEVLFKDLNEKRTELVISIFTELAWAIGFPWIDEAHVKELFEKGW